MGNLENLPAAGGSAATALGPAALPLPAPDGGGCGEPLASAASITKPRASQMLRPKTRSMCECVSTSDRDVYSWQEEAAGVACDPADLLQVQQRAAGRLPGGGGGERGGSMRAARCAR